MVAVVAVDPAENERSKDLGGKAGSVQSGDVGAHSSEGSFSAVSTATIATKYSFFQDFDFRDLQDFHTFAPLRFQISNKKSSNFLPE